MRKFFECSDEEIDEMFEVADTNRDGRISYVEYLSYCCSLDGDEYEIYDDGVIRL